MNFRIAPLLVAASALVLSASLASAQAGLKPIPKPSDRRPGELEGWSDSAKPQGKETGKDKKAAKAGKPAKPEKSDGEKAAGNGIPLPSNRLDPNDYAPVGFDKDGKFGTGMKF